MIARETSRTRSETCLRADQEGAADHRVLALAAGTMLAGRIGALLAVPMIAVGWTVSKTWPGRVRRR